MSAGSNLSQLVSLGNGAMDAFIVRPRSGWRRQQFVRTAIVSIVRRVRRVVAHAMQMIDSRPTVRIEGWTGKEVPTVSIANAFACEDCNQMFNRNRTLSCPVCGSAAIWQVSTAVKL
jgi:hypothetical protein